MARTLPFLTARPHFLSFGSLAVNLFLRVSIFSLFQLIYCHVWEKIVRKSVSGWIPDWFPKVEKEESRKWEPVDGIQEKIICLQHFVFLFIYELET